MCAIYIVRVGYDVKMLNDVLRGARKLFGGTIKGDYGTDRYAPLWKDESTPISRGVSAIFQRVDQDLRAVKVALPNSVMPWTPSDPVDAKMRDFFEFFTQSCGPARVIYNGLVPFAVSMFEYFFSRVFRVLIAYDPYALAKRDSHNLRVDFPMLLQVSGGGRTVEDVIAETYTFQNLDQLNKAYREWLNIDVRRLMYKKKRFGRKVSFLENRATGHNPIPTWRRSPLRARPITNQGWIHRDSRRSRGEHYRVLGLSGEEVQDEY